MTTADRENPIKLEAAFASVCMPDYWGGHHLAHISCPVSKTTTLDQLKYNLRSELSGGAVMGSSPLAELLALDGGVTEATLKEFAEEWDVEEVNRTALNDWAFEAALTAVEAITGGEYPFDADLEPDDEESHAYFVFRAKE